MSIIEDRVVKMEFDNSNFERNATTSMQTLSNLKKSLDNTETTNAFNGLSQAASKLDFSKAEFAATQAGFHIQDVFEKVTRFLENDIARRIVNFGTNLFQSVTTEPISQGFGEYELKMGSIQTIMAGTGESLETVNKYLDELNLYADRTIYSFSDMTSNIGKFTNAGVSLKDATAAIQGVSNVAALSGANTQEASRAMYNFSQALSAGYVKLIDWKSIENANMATVDFKNQLIETALELGTVRKEGDMYITTTTNMQGKVSQAFDATHGFNDALANQWMTTEVLTTTLAKYTDETTELGKKAFAAATDIKTFSQMMDTLKESVGSAWARIFETLFGDFEQSKKLWTSLGNALDEIFAKPVNEFANNFDKAMNEMEGRQALFDGLANIGNTLMSVYNAVKQAFQDIFPPKTSSDILQMINNFRDFSESLTLSDETIQNLRSTLDGFFSIFKILGSAVEAVADVFIGPLFSGISGISSGILETTAGWGEWLTKLAESIEEGDVFKNAFQTALDWVREKVELLSPAFEKIKTALEPIVEKIKEFFSSFKDGKDIVDFLPTDKVSVFQTVLEKIIDVAVKVKDTLKDAFSGLAENINFQTVTNAFETIGAVIEGLWKIVSTVGKGIVDFISQIVNGLSGGDSGILGVAAGGGVIYLITQLADTLKEGKGVLGNASDFLKKITETLGGLKDVLAAYQKDLQAKTLEKIAIAVGILAVSMTVLASIPADQLGLAAASMAGLFEALAIMSKQLGGAGGKELNATAGALDKLAIAVGIMALAMKGLAELSWDEILRGLTGLAGILAELIAATKLLKGDDLVSGSLGLIALGAAIKIIASAMNDLKDLSWEEMAKGLAGVAGILLELVGTTKLLDGDKMVSSGLGMIALGAALKIIASAVSDFAEMSWEEIGRGLATMAGSLVAITASMALMPSGADMLGTGVGMIGVAAALKIIASAVNDFAGLTWDEIARGLVAMGGALVEVVAACRLAEGGLGGATAILLVSVALSAIAKPLKTLGEMPWQRLLQGLLGVGVALGVVVAAGALATTVAPGLLALSAALLAISVAAVGVGAGLALAGVGLSAIAVGIAALATVSAQGAVSIVNALTTIITGIVGLIPQVAEQIGLGMVTIATVLGQNAPVLIDALGALIDALFPFLTEKIPMFVEYVLQTVGAILEAIGAHTQEIVEAVINILIALLDGIAEKLPEFIQKGVDIVVGLITGIGEAVPQLVDAGFKMIIDLLNGLAESINTNTPLVIAATNNLMNAIIQAMIAWLFNFAEQGRSMITNILSGIDEKSGGVITAIEEMVKKAVQAIKDKVTDFKNVAGDLISGFIQGVKDKVRHAVDTVKDFASDVVSAVKDVFDSNSPSKVFMKIGRDNDEGLAIGITQNADSPVKAIRDMGEKVRSAFGSVNDMLTNSSPIISPRLDLSNIARGVGAMGSMFDDPLYGVQNGSISGVSGINYNFYQNNYSPKALSRIDIYRNTKNQFSMLKGTRG